MIKAIKNDIVIVAMHTNLDAAFGGVNFKIAEKLRLRDVRFFGREKVVTNPLTDKKVTGGDGVIGCFDTPLAADDLILLLKKEFDVECVQANELLRRDIRTVALCGGSGSFLLQDAINAGADAFMAKKDPKELPVEEKLKNLFQLQTTLSAIDEKRALRGELPLEVRDLEDELEGLRTRIEKIEQDIKDYQRAITQKKGDIVEAQASLERYNKQLDTVANNREYDTLTKEIEFQTLEIELCNKKIKEAQYKVEEKQKDLEANRGLLEDRQKALEEKRNELDEIMQETREEEGLLKDKASELETKIESGLLRSFKRIRRGARNGLGIVYVQRDACGGCFNKIPPQRQLDVKMHKKIIVCEYCGRILIDPELAGVKIEKAGEEKPKKRRATRKKKEEGEE